MFHRRSCKLKLNDRTRRFSEWNVRSGPSRWSDPATRPFGRADLDVVPEGEPQDDASAPEEVVAEEPEPEEGSTSSGMRYRRQRRGEKGLRDIKTTDRNGQVVGVLAVQDGDDVLLMSSSGKIQRIRVADISVIGRNTQGVRVMRMDEDDKLVGIARIPAEVVDEAGDVKEAPTSEE